MKPEKKAERNKQQTEKFLAKSSKKFPDKFDYTNTKCTGSKDKVSIKCIKHDEEFMITTYNHLYSKTGGCPTCKLGQISKSNTMCPKKFFEECKRVHNNFYDYSVSVFTTTKKKIDIRCPIHGIFRQKAGAHKNKQGCPKCGDKSGAKKRTKSQEQFEREALEKHNGLYDYSLAVYIDKRSKVEIICNNCGNIFWQIAGNHLTGAGCSKCDVERRKEMFKMKYPEFFMRAVEKHGFKYDYSLVVYINAKTKVKIICQDHGVFEQVPYDHLREKGCLKCAGYGWTHDDIIARFKKKHGDRYCYECTEFGERLEDKVPIECYKHGVFFQSALSHISGNGCPNCAGHNKTTKELIEQFIELHGHYYNYDEVKYIKSSLHVKVGCPKHGIFLVRPDQHLRASGCPKCVGKNKTTEEFIEICKKVHNNKYRYHCTTYSRAHDYIAIECPEHGIFYQRASSHMRKAGCQICARKGVSKQQIEWLEYLNVSYDGTIQHYCNGGEHLIKGTKLRADGYDKKTNTIFEYHGDFFHGNPYVFEPDVFNTLCKKTMGELYEATIEKEVLIENKGYKLVTVWEHDWVKGRDAVKTLQKRWRSKISKRDVDMSKKTIKVKRSKIIKKKKHKSIRRKKEEEEIDDDDIILI